MLRSAALQDGYTQAKFDTLESFVISGLVSRERLCWRTEAWATGINDLLTIRNGRTAEDEEEGECEGEDEGDEDEEDEEEEDEEEEDDDGRGSPSAW